jgi:hypothetical protein
MKLLTVFQFHENGFITFTTLHRERRFRAQGSLSLVSITATNDPFRDIHVLTVAYEGSIDTLSVHGFYRRLETIRSVAPVVRIIRGKRWVI